MNPVMLLVKRGNASRHHLALALPLLDIAPVLPIFNAALLELGLHGMATKGIDHSILKSNQYSSCSTLLPARIYPPLSPGVHSNGNLLCQPFHFR